MAEVMTSVVNEENSQPVNKYASSGINVLLFLCFVPTE